MTSTCDKHAIDIISLKRPTTLDKLAETIPKPKGAVPNFGLPKWKEMPLESKVPMVPGPEGAYNFTRRKLGKRLWIPAPDAEFNLSDPYCHEIEFTYDPLHDENLIPYFSRPNVIRNFIKAGLITKDLDAKCSLRDYNMYRKYLRRLHCDSIKKELRRKAEWSIEERAILYAQEQAQKEVRRLNEREKLMEKRRSIIRNREIAEKLKRQKQKEKQQKIEERLQALEQRKHETQNQLRIQIKAHAEIIKQKQKAAAEIARQKIIQTLLEWSRKERIRKRTRQMQMTHERDEKRKKVEQKWEERQEFQRKQIEKEQFLLQCIEDQRKDFIEEYNEKVNRETKRMAKLLKDVKMFIRCYLARRSAGSKERICCKKYMDEDVTDKTLLAFRKLGVKKPVPKIHTYLTPMKEDKDTRKREKTRKIKDVSIKVSRQIKEPKEMKTTKEIKEMDEIKKMQKKLKKVRAMAKKERVVSIQKGGKKRKKRKRKKKRLKKKSKEKFEEAVEEPVTPPKVTETSVTSVVSEPKEKCRCEIIKAMQRATT